MLPRLSKDRIVKRRAVDIQPARQILERFAFMKSPSHAPNKLSRQLGVGAPLSTRRFLWMKAKRMRVTARHALGMKACSVTVAAGHQLRIGTAVMAITGSYAAFAGRVGHVVVVRADAQMPRIAAGWVVARMQDERSVDWDGAVGKRPSNSMSAAGNALNAELSVALGDAGSDPFPTAVWSTASVDLGPESIGQLRKLLRVVGQGDRLGFRHNVLRIGRSVQSRLARLPALTGSFAFYHNQLK